MPGAVDVLMYHSISDAPGPTSIDAATFRAQMDALAAQDCRPITMAQFADWHDGVGDLPPRAVLITFDDGFADFADQAAPVLIERGWTATVFLPTGRMGGPEDWDGADDPPRALMGWDQVAALAESGIDFGGHSVSHADLTTLAPDALADEIGRSRADIEAHLGRTPLGFAPPYGRSNAVVLDTIGKWFRVSFGTRLQRASRRCDILDVPRIEMHYFRDPARWRAYLDRRAELYFGTRRALRRVRRLAVERRWG